MSYNSLENSQLVSNRNLQNAVDTSVLALKQGQIIPANNRIVKKEDVLSYVRIDPNNTSLLAKSSTQMISKKDLTKLPCTCTGGFAPNANDSYCVKIDTVAYTQDNQRLIKHYTDSTNYGVFGTVIYKQNLYNLDGTWPLSNSAAKPTLLTNNTTPTYVTTNINGVTSINPTGNAVYGYKINSFNLITIPLTSPWINNSNNTSNVPPSNNTLITSRLNRSGVWDLNDVNYEPVLGFSTTLTVATQKLYYIGIGCDNYASIKVNGIVILNQIVEYTSTINYFGSPNLIQLFRYWHIYPIILNAGSNFIEMLGNNSGGAGILGLEIYDATEAELIGCTSATPGNGTGTNPYVFGDQSFSNTNLNKYIVFSTAVSGGNFDIVYSCPTGYNLINNNGTYSCQRLLTQSCSETSTDPIIIPIILPVAPIEVISPITDTPSLTLDPIPIGLPTDSINGSGWSSCTDVPNGTGSYNYVYLTVYFSAGLISVGSLIYGNSAGTTGCGLVDKNWYYWDGLIFQVSVDYEYGFGIILYIDNNCVTHAGDPSESTLTFSYYRAGIFTFGLSAAIPSTDIIISYASVFGRTPTYFENLAEASDSIDFNTPLVINAGELTGDGFGQNPMTCAINTYVKESNVTVNGVLYVNSDTFTVGGTTVTLRVLTSVNEGYICSG